MLFVFLKLFATTPTYCCEIPVLFEKVCLDSNSLSKITNWFYVCILKELKASSVYFVLKEGQAKRKNTECSKVRWFWLHCEYFSLIIKKADMCKINLKMLEKAFA